MLKSTIHRTFTVAAALSGVTIFLCGSTVEAKHDNYELVPPPPPTPVLAVPPAPVMLPYSYAQGSVPADVANLIPPSQPAIVPTILRPRPQPSPKPQPAPPRPIGIVPANAPNLDVSYAQMRGYGLPRGIYDASAAAAANNGDPFPSIDAAPNNTWFDASLRWYAQRVNSQQFFHNLNQRDFGPGGAYAAETPAAAPVLPVAAGGSPQFSAPSVVPAPAHHKSAHHSHRSHGRHAKRTIASR